MGLGVCAVSAPSRVPSPPTSTAHCRTVAGRKLRPGTRAHLPLDQRADDMGGDDVDLLDEGGDHRGRAQQQVAMLRRGAARRGGEALRAGEAERDHAALARRPQRQHDVRRAAGGGDAEQHVAGAAERMHLPLEHMDKAVIVADGGQRRTVGGQGDGGQRGAVVVHARDEFGGDVLGVGGAAAIAGDQQLAAAAQRQR